MWVADGGRWTVDSDSPGRYVHVRVGEQFGGKRQVFGPVFDYIMAMMGWGEVG